MRVVSLTIVACASVAFFGCTTALVRSEGVVVAEAPRVLLMPPIVELYVETASGLLEPQAEWSQEGARNLTGAIQEFLGERDAEVVRFAPSEDRAQQDLYDQLQKLHRAVAGSIIAFKYQYLPGASTASRGDLLPTMEDRFEWSLGSAARALQREFGTRYALFVVAYGSHPGIHRQAVGVLVATIFEEPLPMGRAQAYASLVDLETGDLVWFNFVDQLGAPNPMNPAPGGLWIGDLRSERKARRHVSRLLDDLPITGAR
jgi:hypothetical protein